MSKWILLAVMVAAVTPMWPADVDKKANADNVWLQHQKNGKVDVPLAVKKRYRSPKQTKERHVSPSQERALKRINR